jgi:HPt (histidine-containing phosphotransfer) domain-containing protein
VDSKSIIVKVDAELEDLIPGFMKRRREDVVALRSSLAAGDLEKIRIAGHSMKGTGGGYGFDEISVLGAALENAAVQGEAGRIPEIIDRLENYLDRVEIQFD